MRSLPEVVRHVPLARPTDLGSLLAPHLRVTDPANPLNGLETAALAIVAAVLAGSGRQLREELVRERSRFRQLEQLIHRLPVTERGGE